MQFMVVLKCKNSIYSKLELCIRISKIKIIYLRQLLIQGLWLKLLAKNKQLIVNFNL